MDNLPLDSLKIPTSTSAVIFPVDIPTKSVLLFNNDSSNITGYVFRDETANTSIKEIALSNLRNTTGIIINEINPMCIDVIEKITGEDNDIKSEWRFIIILKNFQIPGGDEGLPAGAKWYNINQIPFSRIWCKKERDFLKEFMKSL